jgi:hypothetical protein
MLVSQFLLRLKEELRQAVELHLPDSVSQASTLVAIQEHLTTQSKPYHKKLVGQEAEAKPSFTSSELWKARQLKEFRRANNLCFKCGEKYTPAHTCIGSTTSAINLMDSTTDDGGSFLSDEMLEELETPQFNLLEANAHLSLHAMSGKPLQKSIQLQALVKNQALIILVDSGSSHTFLNSVIAHKLEVAAPISPLYVRVDNGSTLSCTSEVKDFT